MCKSLTNDWIVSQPHTGSQVARKWIVELLEDEEMFFMF